MLGRFGVRAGEAQHECLARLGPRHPDRLRGCGVCVLRNFFTTSRTWLRPTAEWAFALRTPESPPLRNPLVCGTGLGGGASWLLPAPTGSVAMFLTSCVSSSICFDIEV